MCQDKNYILLAVSLYLWIMRKIYLQFKARTLDTSQLFRKAVIFYPFHCSIIIIIEM